MNNSIGRRVLSMKRLVFKVLTTPCEESGLSCLQSACIEGDVDTVNAILNYSPEKLDSAIALGIKIGHNSSEFGGNSISTVLGQKDSEKHGQISKIVQEIIKHFQSQSLLHLAAKKGQVEHLRRLLDIGEHVNSVAHRERYDETPLMSAARCNEVDTVEFLVERGASLELRDGDGLYSISPCCYGWEMKNIIRLMAFGADIWKRNNIGYSAVHLAAEYGHTEAVRLLLEHGADVNTELSINASDDDGLTPLHRAASAGQCDTVNFLLDHGANVNAENRMNGTQFPNTNVVFQPCTMLLTAVMLLLLRL
ncbi:hypothetical protein OS493_012098 [Desmophyllum pertusum]|uniref:Uncharacterized protein n=1 Tax=Desmophyllum pertusum TaxID=174260 RepID=A0A9X0A3M5_9CNID|nr:hypothetical protein OS493_012098 [Desmophyllum pertusum]